MPKNTAPRPDWELVLSSAARLQRILPDAVLVNYHGEPITVPTQGEILRIKPRPALA